MIKISNRMRNWMIVCVFSIAAIFISAFQREAISDFIIERPKHEKPFHDTGQFYNAINKSNRLVVRDGGFNCCGSVKSDQILVEVTNRREIMDVMLNIQFESLEGKPLYQYSCMCCGGPGFDWYKGDKRLALTSLMHGKAVRWEGFSSEYWGPFRILYGDAALCPESAEWINQWLAKHGVKDWTAPEWQNDVE